MDHIPGQSNLPVVSNDEYAEVGTLHRTDKMRAYLIGVAYSLKNISRHLDTVIAGRTASWKGACILLSRRKAQSTLV